jgi:hypothetical protein
MADPPLLRSAAGIVEAPVDATWEALLASLPELAPHDTRTLAHETGVQNLDVVLDQAAGATMRVIIEPARRQLTIEGQW